MQEKCALIEDFLYWVQEATSCYTIPWGWWGQRGFPASKGIIIALSSNWWPEEKSSILGYCNAKFSSPLDLSPVPNSSAGSSINFILSNFRLYVQTPSKISHFLKISYKIFSVLQHFSFYKWLDSKKSIVLTIYFCHSAQFKSITIAKTGHIYQT